MGGGSSTTQSSTNVDPQLLGLYMQNYANANAVANNSAAFQPYTGELVAPFSPLQSQGQQAVLSAANDPAAANSLASALSGTTGLLGFQARAIAAPSISAPAAINPLTVAPSSIAPQSVTASSVTPANIMAGQLASTDLTPYLNPYTNDVINNTLASLALARDQQQVSDNAAATAANAFGGTRQAVQSALTTNDYLRNVAATTAGLNQGAYANAQQAALADVANRLTASQYNATSQLNAGEFNATNQLDASKFNAGNALSAAQANAANLLNAGEFNANALLNTGEFNANALTNINAFNATGAYNAAVANAANALSGANVQLNAAGMMGNLSNDQLNQALQRASAIEAAGAEQTALQQAQDQAAYQEFLRQAQFPIEQQQLRSQALTEIPLSQTTTTNTQSSPGVLGVFDTLANVGSAAAKLAPVLAP